MSATPEHYLLPDWNDLPDRLRSELIQEAGTYCEPGFGSAAALAIYEALRTGLPPQTFPLFAARPSQEKAE